MNENANTLGIYTENIPQLACPHCEAELDVSDFGVFEDIECPSCGEVIKVPGRLGEFILIDELGRGAMGCVYLAQDESLGRLVALKVIRREFGADPKMLETVQREAQAMATLNHRNIVQVYSFGRVEQQPYFVMELLKGDRLDEMMEGGVLVDEERVLEIGLDVAHGLDAANQAGLTHGDIKPANILTNDKGVAKVVDFGLAKFMEPGAEIEVWGTPYYIAPEKARKKGEDSRSDQYSLGGTLFHALAGHPPFDAENPTKVVIAALKEETPELKDHNPEVTDKTAAVIRRMMDKKPGRRYPTYASLVADLELALEAARAAKEEQRLAEQQAQLKAAKRMSPLVKIMILTTVLVLAAIGGWVWMQQQNAERRMQVDYPGPDRELHVPILRSEERNLREAAENVLAGHLGPAKDNLEVAARHIPPEHSAYGWYQFLSAGIYLYAQHPEEARNLLQNVVETEDMIFDGGRVPEEDPRLLAAYALGESTPRELQKSLRKSSVYYQHLAELAQGYRFALKGDPNQAARYFRAYGDYRVQGLRWPYVLRPIAPSLHLPRKRMNIEQTAAETAETATPKEPKTPGKDPEPPPERNILAGLGIRDAENRPVFKTAPVKNGKAVMQSTGRPAWIEVDNWQGVWIQNDQVLVDARGLQLLPERRFSVWGIFRIPTSEQRASGGVDVFFSLGGAVGSNDSAVPGPVRGLVLEMPPPGGSDGKLRLRMGDGEEESFVQSFPVSGLKPGDVHLIGLGWQGWDPDSDEAPMRLSVIVDDKEVASWTLDESKLPQGDDLSMVAFGRGIAADGTLGWRDEPRFEIFRSFVADRIPNPSDIYDQYKDRMDSWENR